jgi:hypothetical protein
MRIPSRKMEDGSNGLGVSELIQQVRSFVGSCYLITRSGAKGEECISFQGYCPRVIVQLAGNYSGVQQIEDPGT